MKPFERNIREASAVVTEIELDDLRDQMPARLALHNTDDANLYPSHEYRTIRATPWAVYRRLCDIL
ncbi:hypothetical protein ACFQY0_09830 [Haloferula chungangensis]|uniref:Uncharacterized protein n=1 Tax=Haloferula chungangensis TaxID=1048331 RepID=A0ABW2L877_9BACT